MSNRSLRVLFLLFLALAAALPLAAGSKDTWIEVQSPNFTVISNAGEKEARKIADQFEQFRGVFHNSLPQLRVDLGKPLVIIAVKNEDSLKVLLPAFWAVKGHTHPAGIYVPGEERHFVALRTDILGENPYVVVYHEYTHALIGLNFRELPVWLSEGLADFFGNSTIEGKIVQIGKIAPGHLMILQQNKFIPIQTLLEADHNSPYYNEQNRATVFYAESWAVTHYLMMDPDAHKQGLLGKFLVAWEASGNQVEAAQKTFGDLEKFGKAMEAYTRQGRFYYGNVQSPDRTDPKSYPSRILSPAEIAAEEGIFYLHTQRQDEAGTALQEAVQADPNLPLAHEGLGMLAISQQHMHAAEMEFARAIELKSTDYFAYYFYAQAQMHQGIRTAEDQAKISASLEKTIALNPQFAPAYSVLASLYSNNAATQNKAIEMGLKAVKLEPGHLPYAISLGHVLLNAGKTRDAAILAKRIQEAAKTPSDVVGAEQLSLAIARRETYEKSLAASRQWAKEAEERERQQAAEAAKSNGAAPAAARSSGAAGAARTENSSSTNAAQPKGQEFGVEGTITSAECGSTSGGRVTLTVNKMGMKFHYSDLSALQVIDSRSTDPDNAPPACAEWKGLRARLYFYQVKNRDYAGELATIQFF